MPQSYDYLIIGQGIAGTVLSYTLLEAGQSVLVIDQPQEYSTSKVAAGLFNPITGRKPTKTWLGEELFPFLHKFYPELEKAAKASFFFPTPIFVPFDSVEKQNNWLSRSAEPGYPRFIEGFSPKKYQNFLHADHGGITLRHSGYVHTRRMLHAFREVLKEDGRLVEKRLRPGDISIAENGIEWEGYRAKKAIFCEGIQNRLNPYFDWLDYRPAKGEILKLEIPDAPFQEIVNRGCWMIPQPDGKFRVGSNYDRSTDPEPTEKGKQQVLDKVQALTPLPYEVIGHEAAIRPATYDRRPFIGLHPEHPQLGLFGGLGSKGISLAPYFAEHFAKHLLEGQELMPEVRLDRKKKKK